MTRHVIRLVHSLFLPAAGQACTEGAWCPAVDVYQTRDGWLVKFELAGVRPEEIDLEVQGQRMTLRGTRRDSLTQEVCHYHRMEIAYSHFERSLELPVRLDDAEIATSYRDGMLLVTIRPTEAAQ
jgi:HSP20 family protein